MLQFLRAVCVALVYLTVTCSCYAQSEELAKNNIEGSVTGARTETYCEILRHPTDFKGKMVRVRALYETDFEKSEITAPSCHAPFMTWVSFERQWESRTSRRVRHTLSAAKWRVQTDVVFVGIFKADGRYGHMDMYPFSIEVYKVEAARASGSFRPLPTQKRDKE